MDIQVGVAIAVSYPNPTATDAIADSLLDVRPRSALVSPILTERTLAATGRARSVGFAAVQNIEAYQMDLYAQLRSHPSSVDQLTDGRSGHIVSA